MHVTKIVLPASLLVLGASGVLAEDIAAASVARGTAQTEVHPVTDARLLIHIDVDNEAFDSEVPENPLAGARGPCFGAVQVQDGATSGGGWCHLTDADGEVAAVRWDGTGMTEGGAIVGTWEVAGGTGKWEGIAGSGDFEALTDLGAGTVENRITGTLLTP